jgi:GTP-binding protein
MEIKTASFVKGITGTDDILHDQLPHIAFIGRSNVGKSSVINSLTNRKNLVKSSSTPGKTKMINFFLINDSHYFVDLPGYGFASTDMKEQEKLTKWISWYLQTDEVRDIKVVLILDAKAGMTEYDERVLALLQKYDTDVVLVVNKIDKLSQSERTKLLNSLKNRVQPLKNIQIIPYSAKSNEGRGTLTNAIFQK